MYLHSHKGSANGILLAFALIIHGRLASWLQSVHFLGIISMPFRCPLCFTRSYRCLFMVIFIEYFRINQTYTSSIWKIPLSRCIPLIQFVVVYPIDDGWTMLFNILLLYFDALHGYADDAAISRVHFDCKPLGSHSEPPSSSERWKVSVKMSWLIDNSTMWNKKAR